MAKFIKVTLTEDLAATVGIHPVTVINTDTINSIGTLQGVTILSQNDGTKWYLEESLNQIWDMIKD